jgi:hypothetical protein
MKKALKIILFNVLFIFFILALFEALMYTLIRQPNVLRHCPKGIRNSIGYLYTFGERKVIQFSPECARYDSELGYTLKPGRCTYAATEFSNLYDINSRGLRDDEKSLYKPDIIVVGDSYAMGWGVNQEDTFTEVLERKSGLTALNAAMASYGTAREMIVLRRLETKNLKFLIIQYCENDFDENKEFFLKGNCLYTMGPDEYQRFTDLNNQPKDYYLGKYLSMKIEKKWKEVKKPKKTQQETAFEKDDVDLFINAVMNSPADLSKVQIVAFEAVGKDDFDRPFIRKLTERIKNQDYPPFIRNMITMDVTKVITRDQYYVLDDHWTQAGHSAIAAALLKTIQAAHNEN